jgi:release factor glutamine methyltransferase
LSEAGAPPAGGGGPTVRDALDAAVPALAAAGCETPRLDAELLIADALGADRGALHARPDRAIEGGHARVIGERVRRRVAREPVAYILGRKGFRRIELLVDSRVLIPRPETELLVEAALELAPGARVHDVGTGSGAVALALLDERPDLAVSASDASPAAVEVARANAERLGLPLDVSVGRGLPGGGHDMVLANLPYVREDEWDGLAPEIRLYEPREALVSGADGLDAIRSLVAEAPPGTELALEHAPGQATAVRALLRDARTLTDLAGHERVTIGSRAERLPRISRSTYRASGGRP